MDKEVTFVVFEFCVKKNNSEAKLTYMMNNANDTAYRILREDVISTAIGEHMVKVCKNMCQVGVSTNRLIRWTETMAAVIRTKSAEQQSLFPSKKVSGNAAMAGDLILQWGDLLVIDHAIELPTSQLFTEVVTRQSSWVANHLIQIIPDASYWISVINLCV